MRVPRPFPKEFHTLDYVLRHAEHVLLFAHTRPDLDAVGSVLALRAYLLKYYHVRVTIGCYSSFPAFLAPLLGSHIFVHPHDLSLEQYDVAIGCDSVDRGFAQIVPRLPKRCVSVAIDHHHDITLSTDIRIIDATYASTTEILYRFMRDLRREMTPYIATALLTGIVGDTGVFQHANTQAHTLTAAADLIRKGASVAKIVRTTFANQKITTLNLWGRALAGARFFEDTGLIVTAITTEDTHGRMPSSEEIKEVATILANVPGVRASLFLFQATPDRIKASIRAPKDAHIDVSAIAHQFGGGGHPLASGFEIPGKLMTLPEGGWKVV